MDRLSTGARRGGEKGPILLDQPSCKLLFFIDSDEMTVGDSTLGMHARHQATSELTSLGVSEKGSLGCLVSSPYPAIFFIACLFTTHIYSVYLPFFQTPEMAKTSGFLPHDARFGEDDILCPDSF